MRYGCLISIIISLSLLCACAAQNNGAEINGLPSDRPNHSEKNKDVPTGTDPFTPGVFIKDFAQHKNTFVTDEILQTLKTNLEALSSKNQEQFVKGFRQGQAESNLFWIQDSKLYRFIEIGAADQYGKAIRISVKYQVKDGDNVSENGTTYVFLKDKDGRWRIEMID